MASPLKLYGVFKVVGNHIYLIQINMNHAEAVSCAQECAKGNIGKAYHTAVLDFQKAFEAKIVTEEVDGRS